MVRIDCLIFGYRKLIIDADDLSKVTSIFINNGISSTISNSGEIIVRERDLSKIKNLLQGRVCFSCSEPQGICGKWISFPYKKTLVASIVISILILALSSLFVWDVRVVGNENITDSEIIYELSLHGFEVGSLWLRMEKSKIEASFLQSKSSLERRKIHKRNCHCV